MRWALAAICGYLLAVPSAHAGEYTVYACRADDSGRNNSWVAGASSSHVSAYSDGCGSGGGGLVGRAGVEAAGSYANAFDAATWRFDAPAGTTVSQVALSGRLYRASGASWGVGLSDQAGSYLLGGISADAMAWESGGYLNLVTQGSTTLYFGVICASGSGCPTTSTGQAPWGYTRARADLYGARVRVSDAVAPGISGVRGALVSGTWVGGPEEVGFDAGDPAGVSSQSYAVGALAGSDPKACDFTRPAPCPTSTGSSFSIDTRAIPDGAQALTLSAYDSAGNRADWNGTVYIDNNVPGPPSRPVLLGSPASRWRSTNGFVLNYENPDRAGGAPLTSHDVQACPADADGNVDPAACSLVNRSGAPGTDTVQVPGPGLFRVRVRVNDSLYSGAWSPWSEVLRFDNVPPGSPTVAFPGGWINAAGAGGAMAVTTASAQVPVSGIESYLVDGLGVGELELKPTGGVATVLPYSSLPEGSTSLTIRAVSGSGLATPAAQQATGAVRKDTIAPSLSVAGVPAAGETVRHPVTLAASATDAISGMGPAPLERPIGEGGFLTFAQTGTGPLRFRGDAGQLSPGDGSHSIGIYATDVAGNASRETHARYRQDTRVPSGGLLPPPADNPSLIRFQVSESCPGEAAIEISTAPGAWQRLSTVFSDGLASAHVPEAVWNSEQPYTLRALVSDCAGNSATLDRWGAGPLAGEPLGQLKPPARLHTTAKATLRAPAKRASAASARRTVIGYVKAPDGSAIAGARVRFEARPRATGQPWTTVASGETSKGGSVSHSIPNRHSQLIRVTVPATDLLAGSTSNVLTTRVKASSSISAKPPLLRNGQRLKLNGRLRGGYVPARFEIALYGKAPGNRSWVPVRGVVAVSRSGRWKASYRFTRTRTRSRYGFRVRIPSRPDYPFSSGYSSTRRVTVVP